jgi:chromosome segregation ATPase
MKKEELADLALKLESENRGLKQNRNPALPDEPKAEPDGIKAELNSINAHLNGNDAELNSINAELNSIKAQLERISESLQTRREPGKRVGRPPALDQSTRMVVKALKTHSKLSKKEIAASLGITVRQVSNALSKPE